MLTLDELNSALGKIDEQKRQMFLEYLSWVQQRLAQTAINEYMRDAGKTAGPRSPSDTGPLRIVTTRLSRSLTGAQFNPSAGAGGHEGISRITATKEGVTLEWGSRVPYARVHEEGFSGTVHIPQHTRTITQAFGRQIAPREVTVKPHSRRMIIPPRPYLKPSLEDNLQAIEEELADRFVDLIMEII